MFSITGGSINRVSSVSARSAAHDGRAESQSNQRTGPKHSSDNYWNETPGRDTDPELYAGIWYVGQAFRPLPVGQTQDRQTGSTEPAGSADCRFLHAESSMCLRYERSDKPVRLDEGLGDLLERIDVRDDLVEGEAVPRPSQERERLAERPGRVVGRGDDPRVAADERRRVVGEDVAGSDGADTGTLRFRGCRPGDFGGRNY